MSTDQVSSELLIQLLLAESHLTNDVDEWVEKSQFMKLITSNRFKDLHETNGDMANRKFMHRCFAMAYCLSQPLTRYDDREGIAQEIQSLLSLAGDEYSAANILKKWLNGVNPIVPPDAKGVADLILYKKLSPPLKGEWKAYPPTGEALHQEDIKSIEKLISELASQTNQDLSNRIEYWHGKKLDDDGRQKKLSIRIK